ncbi:hypothetical protein GM3708_134 [Geminocystis sp. NIES-3708]|uniref:hypothetical protein n=1 Tax=Geminocystis sp. NIES-3708 TaxID=1615909 RepID=UPI0005FCCBEA|nr:hypothetical protein [Geminocystis sp. NIES-3708]BAQ59729.1 hypothetical protein GM3708_134 [Geminocystis sp. NIES-3708]
MNKPTRILENLTMKQLELIIERIVQKNLNKDNNNYDNEKLLNTFGKWEDTKIEEEIIEEIYRSRNNNLESI